MNARALAAPLALAALAGCAPSCPPEVRAALARAGESCEDAIVEVRTVDGTRGALLLRRGEGETRIPLAEGAPVGRERRVGTLDPDVMLQLLPTRVFWEEYRIVEEPGGPRSLALGREKGLEVEFEFDAAGALRVEKRERRAQDVPEAAMRAFRAVEPAYEPIRFCEFRERGRVYFQATKYVGRDELTLRAEADGANATVERARSALCRCGP